MITRRTAALAAAGMLFAPAIVQAGNLMRIRGVLIPVYFGFVDRLRLYHQYGLVLPARVYSHPSIFQQGKQVRPGSLPPMMSRSTSASRA
jgi:hypothetical protein